MNMTAVQDRILIVEDTPIAQKMAVMVMKQFGLNIDIANNGADAITQYKDNLYLFILLDIGLPDMDGYTVTRVIREMDKQKNIHTPIIALTAHLDEETQRKASMVGMDDFLSKPLNTSAASVVLKKYFG